MDSNTNPTAKFQSTLPVRGATPGNGKTGDSRIFQSTLPVRGATCKMARAEADKGISIHAPREGSDYMGCIGASYSYNFNPRSP